MPLYWTGHLLARTGSAVLIAGALAGAGFRKSYDQVWRCLAAVRKAAG